MKKIFLLLLVIIAGLTGVYANNTLPVNHRLEQSFYKEFGGVKEVSWEWIKEKQLYRAVFSLEGKSVNAYFTVDGDFLATSRYITRQEMPLIVKRALVKRYPEYSVRTIIETAGISETNYYITASNDHSVMMIKATPTGELSRLKKMSIEKYNP